MNENDIRLSFRNRKIVGITIISLIALLHIFGLGRKLNGNLSTLYLSYGSDLIMPFGIYFLLCISQIHITILEKWYVKAALIFGLTTGLEILQFFGIYALGATFDPMDILVYALGVGIAVVVDRFIFDRLIPYWSISDSKH
ncbi:hypothetical protein [Algoriphagus sp. CAU 1675]|uniref:hypothetical protein n=1 Tax=Algoriphagus sp. CAU 1675 TaxID=3032597 RepID=UPI0023DB7989|nr:hypothetical protein [Algoriphagus sp. CAU 1675]MDF2156344.1 hypothetical protein [Algoriphagus sp. CAU 1675]